MTRGHRPGVKFVFLKRNIRNKTLIINRIAIFFSPVFYNDCITRKLQKILNEIWLNLENLKDSLLPEEKIEELAKKAKFIRRHGGKIKAKDFLDIMVFNNKNLKAQSLNDISIEFMENHNINVRKQSIDERINDKTVTLMEEIIGHLINSQLDIEDKNSPYFNRLLIKDSTSFQVNEALSQAYPGSGGGGSKAAVRFQFEYDYLNGGIFDISLHPFNDQDSTNSKNTLDKIKEKDLILRDLGYMSLEVLEAIQRKKAYYLSRLNVSTKVYELKNKEYKEIKFTQLKKEMEEKGLTVMEKEVYVGSVKLKSRLVIYLLPEAVYQKRIKRAKAINQKKQRGEVNKEVKSRAHFNLFITNTTQEQISKQKIWSLYRLRWQIELVFKIWKSIIEIDKIKKVKKARLELYFYSKLLLIILGWKVISRVSTWLYRYEKKAISIIKSYKTIIKMLSKQGLEILISVDRLKDFILEFYKISRLYHQLEKRKKEQTSFEIFLDLDIITW